MTRAALLRLRAAPKRAALAALGVLLAAAMAGAAVLALLRRAAGDGRAVVLVTHDEAATAQADRVLRMRDGRLE